MIFLLLLLSLAQSDDLEAILRRLESEDAEARAAAAGDLERFTRSLGEGAMERLKRRADSATGEVKARLLDRIAHLTRVAECRAKLAVFDRLDLAGCAGKRLVLYNPGHWTFSGNPQELSFYYQLGWVIAETPDSITLAQPNLETTTYSKKIELPADWKRFKDKQPEDRPLPGHTRPMDFEAFCRALLEAGTQDNFGDFDHFSRGGLKHELEPALYAWWALQRGQEVLALKLTALAAKVPRRDDKEPAGLDARLAEAVTENLRWQAITGANRGLPRPELLKTWAKIHAISPKFREGEAVEMVRHYEAMVEEDKIWTEPSAEALAALAPAKRAAYWLRQLRDLDATQQSQPGSCHVLGDWAGRSNESPNPADKLVELGWDAIPGVIEGLDDRRPTRSMGYWRHFAPSSFYLLCTGDCCRQIFEAISGVSIYQEKSTSSAMVKDGEAATSKALATKWWAEHQALGAEAYYLKGLGAKDRLRSSAAKLLELDKAKHLPRLIGLLESGTQEQKDGLLSLVAPHLGKDQDRLLDPFLKSESLALVMEAAQALHERCGSDRGARVLLERLKAHPAEDDGGFFMDTYVTFLLRVEAPWVERGLLDLMSSPSKRLRMAALSAGARLPSADIARALLKQMDDTAETGWSGRYSIRYADQAAEAFIAMAGLEKSHTYEGTVAERDRVIRDLRAWWEKNGGTLDFDVLRAARRAKE